MGEIKAKLFLGLNLYPFHCKYYIDDTFALIMIDFINTVKTKSVSYQGSIAYAFETETANKLASWTFLCGRRAFCLVNQFTKNKHVKIFINKKNKI